MVTCYPGLRAWLPVLSPLLPGPQFPHLYRGKEPQLCPTSHEGYKECFANQVGSFLGSLNFCPSKRKQEA